MKQCTKLEGMLSKNCTKLEGMLDENCTKLEGILEKKARYQRPERAADAGGEKS